MSINRTADPIGTTEEVTLIELRGALARPLVTRSTDDVVGVGRLGEGPCGDSPFWAN